MTPNVILWIYIVLLVAGGLMGLIVGKSKMSLIMSLAFAVPLILSATRIVNVNHLVDIVLAVLVVFFGLRFAKGKKFMPMGMMCLCTVIALAAMHLVK